MSNNLQEIYNKINIKDLFPDAVKRGRAWVMLCPFHQENKPSFTIYPNEGRFYCFGCQEKGNYIDYLIKTNQVKDFKEAITYLSTLAGIEIKFNGNGKNKEIYETNHKIALYFNKKFRDEYLSTIGFSDTAIINEFLLGYAQKGYTYEILKSGIANKEHLTEIGLINEEGKETFCDRIIFPILEYGLVKGFSGRALKNNQEPKYLNTKCERSKILYNLNPEVIKQKGYVILVEGYKDCISLHANGYQNTVALGTCSISEYQIYKLKKITNKVLLMLDGDDAGQKGTIKSARELIANGFTVKIATLPAGIDPHSFIENGGNLKALFKSVQLAEEYLLSKVDSWEDKFLLLNSISSKYKVPDLINFVSTQNLSEAEKTLFEEIQARKVLNKFLKETGKVLYKSNGTEIYKWFNYLVVYEDNEFQFLIESTDIVRDKQKIIKLLGDKGENNDNTNII